MLLIGSRALIANGIETGRKPLDIDVIGTFDELTALTAALKKRTRVASIPLSSNKTVLKCEDGRVVEFEIAWSDSSGAELLKGGFGYCPVVDEGFWGFPRDWGQGLPITRLATLDILYSLKMSHRYLKDSPHFRKTRDDIMLMRRSSAKLIDATWMKKREDETYWYKHPKLNVKKGDFFKGDGVEYVYDHDDIHKAVAHYKEHRVSEPLDDGLLIGFDPLPAYRLYMKDGAEVQCDKAKFFDAHEDVRLYGVLEEAMVLALERSQIPFRGKVEPRRSFDIALTKVCTSITSGWFREFAWENFDKVEAMYEPDYVDRFWAAVAAGKVRDFDAEKAY